MLGLPDWEKQVFLAIQGIQTPWLNQIMIVLSSGPIWFAILGVLLFCVYKKQSRYNFFLITLMVCLLLATTDSTTSHFFKNLVRRLRPCKMTDLQPYIANFNQGCGGKWGFFSSHSSNIAATIFFLGSFGFRNKVHWVSACVMALLVAFSRVYLGAHLPLDVIVGLAWGTALAYGWRFLAKASLREPVSS